MFLDDDNNSNQPSKYLQIVTSFPARIQKINGERDNKYPFLHGVAKLLNASLGISSLTFDYY
jgi:hypothetical protein